VVMFISVILPTLNLSGGGTLREFVKLVLPMHGSRNREWVDALGLPKELWPYVTNLTQGGSHDLLEDFSLTIDAMVEDWQCNHNEPQKHTQVHFRPVGISGVATYHDGHRVLFYDRISNMATALRRAMLCRHCVGRGQPGYLLILNDKNFRCGCLQGGRLAAPTRCHRCGHCECFLCASEKNTFDWATWPPSIRQSVVNLEK
jgi:hypothetical protein